MTKPLDPNDSILGPARGSPSAIIVSRGNVSHSSITGYLKEVYRLAPLTGIDPAICVAQSHLETNGWTSWAWVNRRNPAGIGITDGKDFGYSWDTGTDAARAQIVHLGTYVFPSYGWPTTELDAHLDLDPRFKAAYHAGWDGTVRTIRDLTGKWATDPDYHTKICKRGNELFGFTQEKMMARPGYKFVEIAGLGSVEIPKSIEFRQELIPEWQKKQRPGLKRWVPGDWIAHETGNPRPGMDAAAHSRYLDQGAPDNSGNSQSLGFHFTGDDRVVIQKLPVNENSWQSADDYSGPGNRGGVSYEQCINQGIWHTQARWIHEQFAGAIIKAAGLNPKPKRHWDFNFNNVPSKRHHCPDLMMNSGYWPTFEANVAAIVTGETPVDNDYPEGMDRDIAAELFGSYGPYKFDPAGPVSKLWLATGNERNAYSAIKRERTYGARQYFYFVDGLVIWRANPSEPFRVLGA